MSSVKTLARPYARAAFETALAAGALTDWQRGLATAAAFVASPELSAVLGNPKLTPADTLRLVLPPGVAADAPFARFLDTLIENRRLHLLPEISAQFDQHKREHEQVLKVRVRAAIPLDGALAERIAAALERRFRRRIELEGMVDPRVLGGAVIEAGDVVIDGSVRGRLERLAQALAH